VQSETTPDDQALRPLFDRAWNGGGWPRSQSYDPSTGGSANFDESGRGPDTSALAPRSEHLDADSGRQGDGSRHSDGELPLQKSGFRVVRLTPEECLVATNYVVLTKKEQRADNQRCPQEIEGKADLREPGPGEDTAEVHGANCSPMADHRCTRPSTSSG
jgi:hypothetical protein